MVEPNPTKPFVSLTETDLEPPKWWKFLDKL